MVFDFFEKISSIPRGSGNNEGISNFLVEFAKEHGLRYVQDEALNVVIYKDATPGYEQCPPLIFQGHMDMVCEKTKDSDHDFTKDPIKFVIEDGFITADGTTSAQMTALRLRICLIFCVMIRLYILRLKC